MSNSIWVVVNAGGDSREKEEADAFNAEACRELTCQKINDNADIVYQKRLRDARKKLSAGDRIAMLQGGGKQWRDQYGSGQLVAAGRFKGAEELTECHTSQYKELHELTREYFKKDKLKGILFYDLCRAKVPIPGENIHVRPIPGDNFIEVRPDHRGYHQLDKWWNENFTRR